ncbi:MAG TPA: hypothetical protein VF032_19520 [Thermoleophilaceae bacterium]
MPSRGDDKYFGGVKGAAEKAFASMQRTYGRKDAEHVYKATIAKRKRKARKR